MDSVWQWISDLHISGVVRDSSWVFPVFECVHLYSMVCLIALVGFFDIRLMGSTIDRRPISEISGIVSKWIWIPFVLNFCTGILLFASKATEYPTNKAFVIKMALIFVGLIYHWILLRKAKDWDTSPLPLLSAKIVGTLSLAIWIGVISASRWIAYLY